MVNKFNYLLDIFEIFIIAGGTILGFVFSKIFYPKSNSSVEHDNSSLILSKSEELDYQLFYKPEDLTKGVQENLLNCLTCSLDLCKDFI
jgi:hypothetical protein